MAGSDAGTGELIMAKQDLDQAYKNWSANPTQDAMGSMLDSFEPVIQSALTSYAGGNKGLHSQAKKLAAQAVQNYDPTQGTKLQTYLMSQLQPLRRLHATRSGSVRVPERVRADLYHLRQAQQNFHDRFGRDAADSELAEQMGVPIPRIRHVRKFMKHEMPESALVMPSDEGDNEVFYPGVQQTNPNDVWLEYVHHDASPIDQKILEWKTGYNGKQKLSTLEIARRLRISPSAVSQRASRMGAKLNELQATEM
jgi:DNA-directed RNA polymerase specialized sigma subunit